MTRKTKTPIRVEDIKHVEGRRKNIPTAEHQSVMTGEESGIPKLLYPRKSDLDPQLVWRGKDDQDRSLLEVDAPPIYIQEKIHPKALIDDLVGSSNAARFSSGTTTLDLFEDFDGIPKGIDKTEFYQHEQNWTNRMILGDAMQVMASLAERESLRGKVQCIYFDPPYGINFNSNFQWSTTTTKVNNQKASNITREPEQVRAFRDTWKDGIHSYLNYIRERLIVSRDLLADSGSLFLQISDENLHLVRSIMDEVFGPENFCSLISFVKTSGLSKALLYQPCNYIIWYAKSKKSVKYHPLYVEKDQTGEKVKGYGWYQNEKGVRSKLTKSTSLDELNNSKLFKASDATAQGNKPVEFSFQSKNFIGGWKTSKQGMDCLVKANRLIVAGNTLSYVRFIDDFPVFPHTALWTDTGIAGFGEPKIYVVQTNPKVIQRCLLMTTDPGDLVLDPTCGSGTTAKVAEQWGRRWITIDTSRVALALARSRIMGTKYPFYLLSDSAEGQTRLAELTGRAPSIQPTHQNIKHGFVCERVKHVTLGSIARNAMIPVIWDKHNSELVDLLAKINQILQKKYHEWEVPFEFDKKWPQEAKPLHERFLSLLSKRQEEIDKSINEQADYETLHDKPAEDTKRVRVAGPFTVESLSPHRVLGVDHDGSLIDPYKVAEESPSYGEVPKFEKMILENLLKAGVQQRDKNDRIVFESIEAWPGGRYLCAFGVFKEGDTKKRAGILVGPEFGTVSRPDLVEAAREAGEANFDVLITCAFNYDAMATEFSNLGKIKVLKARMNADLHMAGELKNTGAGNLFVVFGEPDMAVIHEKDGLIRIHVKGVDVFDPTSGEVRSDDTDGIACWFIDTDYNGESFFVRHAYFLGQKDPYKSLKTTLKAEIDKEAWESLHSDISRPFEKPKDGRIAVKVINHLGDEVLKVLKV
jgi:adenine-specific DNA-methyltransferase